MKPSRRIALIGLDGFSPIRMERLIARGELEAIGRIAREGATVPLISTLPATTPVAWAAIATGSMPSRNGIEGFVVHRPGARLDRPVSGCYSDRCRAEPIWETASSVGRRSFVLKFPLSYPSSTATFRLDGAAGWGGLRCLHELASPAVTASDVEPKEGAPRFAPEAGDERTVWRARWVLPTHWGGPPVAMDVDVVRGDRPRVLLWWERGSGAPAATLEVGGWSEPLTGTGSGRQGKTTFSFRVKLLSLDADSDPIRLRLFNTALHERHGHSTPASVWDELLAQCGPIEEQTEPSLVFDRGLDLDTLLEIFELNASWLERASTTLLQTARPDLFMVQAHFIDWTHHLLEGAVDPRHPDYDAKAAPRYERFMLESYKMADRLVGAIRSSLPPDTDLVVVGDHGQDVVHTSIHANEWLASRGLLAWSGAGEEVDWSRTAAYAAGNYLYLNVRGREPTGIIEPAGVPAFRDELVESLLRMTDPRDGTRPVAIAGPKDEFAALGADGAGVGDVVFCLRPGYQVRNGRGETFARARALREFTSGHDHFWPLSAPIQTRLFGCGPSFRSGHAHRRLGHVVDVAPTLCAVLGIPQPAQCEGRALDEILTVEPDQESELDRRRATARRNGSESRAEPR